MKSIIKFGGLFFLFTCTILILLDIQQVNARKDDMEEALSVSMRNVLKGSVFTPMYEMDEKDMRIELIRNLAENIQSNGKYKVIIQESSLKGLLDVKIKNEFTHNNGVEGSRELRRTLLLEDYKK